MKDLALLLCFPILLFVSCKGKTVEEIAEKYPDGTPKIVRYYNEDAQIREMTKEIRYYPNHNKFYEGEFKSNRKEGKWIVWYQNGSIWSEGFYTKGLDDGLRTGYYESGKKHFEGKYDNGKMVGTWKFWDEKGALAREIDYDKKK
jgi:antitoxin component YwqK of YwqJK toxin-antitoxin module